MLETNKYSIINIRNYLEGDDPNLGEDVLNQILSDFSCPKNPDVEQFLGCKKLSIDTCKIHKYGL